MNVSTQENRATKIVRSYTIRRPAAELYNFWRDLENIPLVIKKPAAVTVISSTVSHWEVSAPGKSDPISWDAHIVKDVRNQLIAWSSKADGVAENSGSITFSPAPDDQGTEVTVTVEFNPPGGAFTAWIAKLSPDDPAKQVADTLRRFKSLMEAGEIPTTDGQPVGEPQKSKEEKKS